MKKKSEAAGWIWKDTVWIITSAGADEVKQWLGERFRADDILVGWSDPAIVKVESYKVPEGMQAIGKVTAKCMLAKKN
jgi:hypothetical protein